MKPLSLALKLIIIVAIGLLLYFAGQLSVLRKCPADHHGAKLLHSEQRTTGTVCTYASRWEGYGRRIVRKTP